MDVRHSESDLDESHVLFTNARVRRKHPEAKDRDSSPLSQSQSQKLLRGERGSKYLNASSLCASSHSDDGSEKSAPETCSAVTSSPENISKLAAKPSKNSIMPWREFKSRVEAAASRSRGQESADLISVAFDSNSRSVSRSSSTSSLAGKHLDGDEKRLWAQKSSTTAFPRSVSGPSGPPCAKRSSEYSRTSSSNWSSGQHSFVQYLPEEERIEGTCQQQSTEGEDPANRVLLRRATVSGVRGEGIFGRAGTCVELSVEKMMAEPLDPAVQEEGLRRLQNYAIGTPQKQTALRFGAARVVATALSRFPDELSIQTIGLQLVSDLCSAGHDAQTTFSEELGVESVVNALKRSEEKQHIKSTAGALQALRACCHECECAQEIAAECGAIDVMLQIMRKQKGKHAMQIRCLHLLEALTRDNDETKMLVRVGGGVEEVLSCMRNFKTSDRIQELATEVLAILSCDHQETQISIGANGGVRDALQSLELAKDSESAVGSACECLRYLAIQQENRVRIIKAGGVGLIMGAAERMKAATGETVAKVLLAIANFTFDDPSGKSEAAKQGGICTLVAIMAIHEEDVAVIEYVCRVLRNISDGAQATKKLCFKQGAVAAVAAMMKSHLSSSGIQEHGAAMLINMLDSFPQAVRSTKLEAHLQTVCDVHSLCQPTFFQTDYLYTELTKRPALTQFLGRRFTRAPSGHSSGSGAGEHLANAKSDRPIRTSNMTSPRRGARPDFSPFTREENDDVYGNSMIASRDSSMKHGQRSSLISLQSSATTGVTQPTIAHYPESNLTTDQMLDANEIIEY